MNTEKLLAGRYRIVEKVGSGGMAIVYRAEDINTSRSVAIKILKAEFNADEEFSQRFQREADAISQMTHHNIVNLLDVGFENESRYLVMEYVQGKTLKDLIREKGKMSPEVSSQIAIRILAALKHAHEHGIIHRDIKPQNILVHDDGHIKVADFGIATKIDSETLAKSDNVMGSVHYISPEQASGKDIGATSDIYSVGVVLYEMLTGRVPYDGDTVVAVAMQHLRGAPTPIQSILKDAPKGLVYVVGKAMEKDPKNRYQTALDMAADIKAAIGGTLDMQKEAKDRQNSAPIRPVRKMSASQRFRIPRSLLRKMTKVALMAGMTLSVFTALIWGGVSIYQNLANAVVMPDLVGMQVDAALRTAQREGINTEVIMAHHPSIAAEQIIMQAPEYDSPMRRGDTVVLTVSKGPSTYTVPEIRSILSSEAVATLQKMGVSLTVVEKVVSNEPIDMILTQNPAAGALCAAGDTIQVTVSGGAVTVPDLQHMAQEDYVNALLEAGLVPGATESATTTDPDNVGLVASQKPAAGAQVVYGASVTVAVYEGVRYQGLLTVSIPENEQGVQVKITYMRADGSEEEQYSAMHAASLENEFELEVFGDAKGEATYKLYLNGEYHQDFTAVLE